MNYAGDFAPAATVRLRFNTHKLDGSPVTLAGTPAVAVYKGSTTESTAGVTLTVDYDGRTGFHDVVIDTSADGTFYAAGNDFTVILTAGTADGVSVAGGIVGSFSLANRSPLRPTVAGRTLDVSATGEAGLDWANVGSPTTVVGLSGTTVKTATDVETRVAELQARLPADPASASGSFTLTSGERTTLAGAILDLANGVETGRTLRQALRLILAALAGKLSGAATATITIRDSNDGKNRIVATVDADGNRTAVTYDVS